MLSRASKLFLRVFIEVVPAERAPKDDLYFF